MTPEIRIDSDGTSYVVAADVAKWLNNLVRSIEVECLNAPVGCDETRAYLYGEICGLRLIARQVESWVTTKDSDSNQASKQSEP